MEQFLTDLAQTDEDEFTSVLSFLERCAEHGPPHNPEKSRPVGDQIFEGKCKSTRFCFFYATGSRIICTHGFHKPQKKVQNAEIKAAKKTRAAFLIADINKLVSIET